jgi:hypothetical protein
MSSVDPKAPRFGDFMQPRFAAHGRVRIKAVVPQ